MLKGHLPRVIYHQVYKYMRDKYRGVGLRSYLVGFTLSGFIVCRMIWFRIRGLGCRVKEVYRVT